MTMQSVNLNRPNSRPRQIMSITDRHARLAAMTFSISHVPKIMAWGAELYQDPTQPMSVRRWASENLMDRAPGRPAQAVEEGCGKQAKHTLQVTWRPANRHTRSDY